MGQHYVCGDGGAGVLVADGGDCLSLMRWYCYCYYYYYYYFYYYYYYYYWKF